MDPATARSLRICVAYGLVSMLISLNYKLVLSSYAYDSKFLMLSEQLCVSLLFCSFAKRFLYGVPGLEVPSIRGDVLRSSLPSGLLFVANIVVGWFGLQLVPIPLFLCLRRTTTAFTLLLEYLILGRKQSLAVNVSVLLIVSGAVLAGWQTMSTNWVGFAYTIVNNLLTAASMNFQKRFSDTHAVRGFGLVRYNALVALPICLLGAAVNNEFAYTHEFAVHAEKGFWTAMASASLMGLCMTYITFLSTTVNSPLATSVTGNAKDMLATVVAAFVFRDFTPTVYSVSGILLSFVGAAWFSWEKLREAAVSSKRAQEALSDGALTVKVSPRGGTIVLPASSASTTATSSSVSSSSSTLFSANAAGSADPSNSSGGAGSAAAAASSAAADSLLHRLFEQNGLSAFLPHVFSSRHSGARAQLPGSVRVRSTGATLRATAALRQLASLQRFNYSGSSISSSSAAAAAAAARTTALSEEEGFLDAPGSGGGNEALDIRAPDAIVVADKRWQRRGSSSEDNVGGEGEHARRLLVVQSVGAHHQRGAGGHPATTRSRGDGGRTGSIAALPLPSKLRGDAMVASSEDEVASGAMFHTDDDESGRYEDNEYEDDAGDPTSVERAGGARDSVSTPGLGPVGGGGGGASSSTATAAAADGSGHSPLLQPRLHPGWAVV